MNTHLKVVAICHLIFGVLGLVAAAVVFALFSTAGGIVVWNGHSGVASLIGVLAICFAGFIALLSLPRLLGGWAILAEKPWARVLMIAVGILDLLHFPIGTALGIYTLWVLLK